MKIKKGDKVKVIAGKDKGQEGEVEMVNPKKKTVILPGINVYKKHVKGFQGQKGGIYDLPRPLDVSKVALICPKCKKVTRVAYKFADNEKVRVCAKCKKEIDSQAKKK